MLKKKEKKKDMQNYYYCYLLLTIENSIDYKRQNASGIHVVLTLKIKKILIIRK